MSRDRVKDIIDRIAYGQASQAAYEKREAPRPEVGMVEHFRLLDELAEHLLEALDRIEALEARMGDTAA